VLDTVKARQRTSPPADAGVLEDVVLQDHEGRPIRLGDIWKDRPAVLAFIRHYGCVFCRDQAVKLHRVRDDFEAAGVRLVMIGHGTPEMAAAFRRAQGVDLPVLVDPDRRVYEAIGAKVATLQELIGPRQILAGLRAAVASRMRQGDIAVHQGRIIGHAAQLGGVLIVAPDGSVRYSHLAEDASDYPPAREVLAAARAIGSSSRNSHTASAV
jgi:prostamide/prostaglandin F2alpha synthase